MLIIYAIASILAIAVFVWLADRILSLNICPICAGVFLTWSGLLVLHFSGYRIDLAVPALLMGGSVVGIAYQLEKKFRGLSADKILLWRALFLSAGFAAAYGVLAEHWAVSAGALAFLMAVTFLFWRFNLKMPTSGGLTSGGRETAEEIEKKMKDCC